VIANSINNQYRIFLPLGFISKTVREIYEPYLKDLDFQYENLVSYLNSTICGAKLPGIENIPSEQQVYDRGRTRQFSGSLPFTEYITKELTIVFKLKDAFFNWFILYECFKEYMDAGNKNIWMPDISCQLTDTDGNIIGELIYKEVMLQSLSDIVINMQSNNTSSTEFELVVKFLHLEFNSYFNKKLNTPSE